MKNKQNKKRELQLLGMALFQSRKLSFSFFDNFYYSRADCLFQELQSEKEKCTMYNNALFVTSLVTLRSFCHA